MDNIKNIVVGGVLTLVVGGSAFTFSQQDVVNNFASDTGLTQEQAEVYVANISEEEMVTFEKAGNDYISESRITLGLAVEIDCVNYTYEWESASLSCSQGKAQLEQIARTELALGESYIALAADDATEADIQTTINYLDRMNSDYDLPIVKAYFTDIQEMRMTNSYNKSIFVTALEQ